MQEEKVLFNATLCYLVKENKVLLAIKAKKIGQGCWNGYGGGIDGDETPEQSVIRELFEESDIKTSIEHLSKVAIVDFHNTKSDNSIFSCRVHVYFVNAWKGEAKETEEMLQPTWFNKNNLPLDKMMPADKFWLPEVLAGKKIIAQAHYGPFQKTLLKEVKINYVESL
jgi:ADP-ribose pyrophosphatase YjhB (NUDIX family)